MPALERTHFVIIVKTPLSLKIGTSPLIGGTRRSREGSYPIKRDNKVRGILPNPVIPEIRVPIKKFQKL